MNILKTIWKYIKKGWMKFAHTLGRINTTILLSIIYFIIVGIYYIISSLLKLFLLPFKKAQSTYWIDHEPNDQESYKHPF